MARFAGLAVISSRMEFSAATLRLRADRQRPQVLKRRSAFGVGKDVHGVVHGAQTGAWNEIPAASRCRDFTSDVGQHSNNLTTPSIREMMPQFDGLTAFSSRMGFSVATTTPLSRTRPICGCLTLSFWACRLWLAEERPCG